MKKKLISLALSLCMLGSMLAGCGNAADGNTSSSSSSSSSSTQTANAASDGKIKIGVSIWSSTDVLGSQCKMILDEAADAL